MPMIGMSDDNTELEPEPAKVSATIVASSKLNGIP